MKDKKHIIIIFSLILALLAVFLVFTMIVKPKSFDKFGHYRWNSINEIKSQKIVNQNIHACAECHKDIYRLHEKDAHYHVPCVDCHGAGDKHIAYYKGGKEASGITKKQAELKKEYKLEGCLYCHRKLSARPSDFPQINRKEHFKFLHVTNPDTKCTDCHSPHEPIFLLTDVSHSRLHPIVYRCRDCHNKEMKGDYSNVKDHPKIFECKDCHRDIVADFVKSPHNQHIECRSCHLFHKESETIGRIYKNGNARFCLLCHEKKSFKDKDYPPKIEWPAHIANLGYKIKPNEKICLDCHAGQIHKMFRKVKKSPHQANWKIVHTKYAVNKSKTVVNPTCGSCHQNEFCYSCHRITMPHPRDWLDIHYETAQKRGKALCYSCHKKSFCSDCHD